MGKFIDLTGQQFGCWKVLERDVDGKGKDARWFCLCTKCGQTVKSIAAHHLKAGANKSCGCEKTIHTELIGKKFGKLTVLEQDLEYRENHNIKAACLFWKCRCECGRELTVEGRKLRNGSISSCSVCSGAKLDLTGQRFGRLTVIKSTNQKYKNTSWIGWECKCDCGNIVVVAGTNLKNGTTTSCGCYSKEISAMLGRASAKDLTGQIFGYLKAIRPTDERANSCVVWECLCLNCGNLTRVASNNLISGNTKSCGCLTSIGEANIKSILNQNKIQYVAQQTYDDLRGKNGNYYRYDFYLPDYNRLIEFDGEQHFQYRTDNSTWNTKERFEEIQKHDKIKNEYALSHNIELVRIPYWKRDAITLDLILGDKYLIKKEE